ncbi:MAG: tetratricopeptide repeat protein [Candidatus Zixiibacteriota bacterium]
MDSYRLDSRIVDNEKEYLIQTVNDVRQGVIKTSFFVNGELMDASVMPHSEEMSENEILNLVKTTHGDKKSELEYLLKSYRNILEEGRPEMMFHLGSALFYRRMYPEARQLFQSAVKIRHDYHEAYYFLSQTELMANHIDAAVKAGLKAVEIRPQFADYRNILGEAFMAAGSCRRAVIEFEDAIKLNIYYADAYFNLALAYTLNAVTKEDFNLYTDLTTKTMDLLNKAVLINPDYKTSTFDEAVAALTNGELKRAFALFKGVRDEKKEKQRQGKAAHFHRFLMYTEWLSQSNIDDRIKQLQNEIDRNPSYVDLYYELGACYLHQAKFAWQKSIEQFKKALEINPSLAKAKRSLELSEENYLKLTDAIFDITEKYV